ncbi:hypothetical protein KOW79_022397 [Hemibagrus wyckioides]|uniref:non-specific serine/threonine protein kinase n=1 Tax=Hemibagrus wyckioides TaxID=337641 RepID=A0A9D3MZV4_9TELE|nr:hypothetical protein KOW79_022397 [Hemibagrus wyckioides]
MGDDLASRNLIYPADICYVVAKLELGSRRHFQLIRYDSVPFGLTVFVNPIMRTEIQRFRVSEIQELKHDPPNEPIPELQPPGPEQLAELEALLSSRYQLGDLLGNGCFGFVFKAVRIADNKKVAVKVVKKSGFTTTMKMPGETEELPSEDTPSKHFFGTIFLIPPECLFRGEYMGVPATIWGLGILLYHFLSGQIPFIDIEQDFSYGYLNALPDVSQECFQLLMWCLDLNPETRPTFELLARHEWFTGGSSGQSPVYYFRGVFFRMSGLNNALSPRPTSRIQSTESMQTSSYEPESEESEFEDMSPNQERPPQASVCRDQEKDHLYPITPITESDILGASRNMPISPVLSYYSMKSDQSMKEPLKFNQGSDAMKKIDPVSPAPTLGSVQSVQSMDPPHRFSGRESCTSLMMREHLRCSRSEALSLNLNAPQTLSL